MFLNLIKAIIHSTINIVSECIEDQSDQFLERPVRYGITRSVASTAFGYRDGAIPQLEDRKQIIRGTLIVQEHEATHKHLDVSLIDEETQREVFRGAAVKSRMRPTLASIFPNFGRNTSLHRQPEHSLDYIRNFGKDGWEYIPEGYGRGRVKQIVNTPITFRRISNDIITFTVYDNSKHLARTYTLINVQQVPRKSGVIDFLEGNPRTQDTYLFMASYDPKKKAPAMEQLKRHEYSTKIVDIENPIIEEKVDGNNERIFINDDSINLWGTRPNKDGLPLEHTEHVMNGIKIPRETIRELSGTVLHGELFHPSGVSFVSGILNSKPDKAQKTQLDNGNTGLAIFDITTYRGKDVSSEPYSVRRELYTSVVRALNHPLVRTVRVYDSIDLGMSSEQEGVVVKDPNCGFNESKWIKVKHHDTSDALITALFDASAGSKYDGVAVGGFIVDLDGTKVKVGTGLDDHTRRDAFEHPENYIGKYAEIEYMQRTANGSARAPVFVRMHPEKGN